jgi:hypothetical protein
MSKSKSKRKSKSTHKSTHPRFNPSTSVIVPWRDIGQKDRNDIAEWCFERYRFLFPEAEIIFCDSGDEIFSRGKSINKGVKECKGEYVIITDADYLFSPVMARDIVNKQPWTVAVKNENYYFLDKNITNRLLQDDPILDIKTIDFKNHTTISPFPVNGGILAMPKENFLQVQFDPNFLGYGYEDDGFGNCMRAFFGTEFRTNNNMYHMCHVRTSGSVYMQHSYPNKDYYDKVYKPMLDDKKLLREYIKKYQEQFNL